MHGHDWYATIEIAGHPNPDTGLFDTDGPELLRSFLDEVDGATLNDMLPGINPTAQGVAMWLCERCRMHVPGLVSITVGFSDHSVTVEV
jgi:6-pyruvoyl-tetrahydropterin synthase